MSNGYYFARIQHNSLGQRLPGIAVMRADAIEIVGPPTRHATFVAHYPDLTSAMAEVRRLNAEVSP